MQTNIAAGKKKRKRKWDAIVRQQISGSQPGDPRDRGGQKNLKLLLLSVILLSVLEVKVPIIE